MGNPQPNPKLQKQMGYIYCLIFPSGKMYIGQTTRQLNIRISEHNRCYKGCLLLNNAIKKYKEFNTEILLEVNNDKLDHYETIFIDIYNTIEPNGYNIRSGGSSNSKHNILSKQRMSDAKKGNKNHNFGKPRTDLTKAKLSIAKSGINHHFYGKTLSYDHKLKLSVSHKKSSPELPMYVVYIKERPLQYQQAGYAVLNHPYLKNKYFTSGKFTLEEKKNQALLYLNSCNMDAVQRLNGSGLMQE